MLLLFVLGCIFFPLCFATIRWSLQNHTSLKMGTQEAVLVASKLVSSVQAIMASTAGYIVSTSCKHIIDDQHWLSSAYTQFAVPYFIYDIYAMFLCHWHKHQVKGHGGDDGAARAPGSTWAVVRGYLHKEFLMVLHHAAMVLVCFPLSVVWRQGKGDFFLGCMLMAEVSTPFVCLGKILIQLPVLPGAALPLPVLGLWAPCWPAPARRATGHPSPRQPGRRSAPRSPALLVLPHLPWGLPPLPTPRLPTTLTLSDPGLRGGGLGTLHTTPHGERALGLTGGGVGARASHLDSPKADRWTLKVERGGKHLPSGAENR
ncbi:ceramide synthase isoform X1 [Perognathus longimembris pacificus]|uniref:ceramide synthase isoform X1 n=1 Tax=Perognathus longimembris pacificus TaxID=214514 RepID=UPI002018516C|nr:ceramide synthase isoform X1 [Perognathus longimembris pacificus]XP_048188087.1 ceramide synthase isoform X1 [Perognathus longimembris pacificus]XP_048188088.1 ceramide synthase isoform X1 [Perognathus longimembris pacificus]XP_048188090.1 ceramide synthase isoform X1 [Perognathus longimembris pacificus]XP_048188091.1 ceramide synthase isoform X1 [Perognathus longimembris pacificus]